MQDQKSYDNYIQSILKEHSKALQQIRNKNLVFNSEELSNINNIDKTIKQSQQIVQQSLQLLEDKNQPQGQRGNQGNSSQKGTQAYNNQVQIGVQASQNQKLYQNQRKGQEGILQPHADNRQAEINLCKSNEEFNFRKYDKVILDNKKGLQQSEKAQQSLYNQILNEQQRSMQYEQTIQEERNKNSDLNERVQVLQKCIKDLVSQLEEKSNQCQKLQSQLSNKEQLIEKQNFQLSNCKNQIEQLEYQLGMIPQKENEGQDIYQKDKQFQKENYQTLNEEVKSKLMKAYETILNQQEMIKDLQDQAKISCNSCVKHLQSSVNQEIKKYSDAQNLKAAQYQEKQMNIDRKLKIPVQKLANTIPRYSLTTRNKHSKKNSMVQITEENLQKLDLEHNKKQQIISQTQNTNSHQDLKNLNSNLKKPSTKQSIQKKFQNTSPIRKNCKHYFIFQSIKSKERRNSRVNNNFNPIYIFKLYPQNQINFSSKEIHQVYLL